MIPRWPRSKIAHYNLGEMAIVLGIYSVLVIPVAVAVGASLHFLGGVQVDVAGYAGMALWFILVGWLWLVFVVVGRERPDERTSTADLTILQIILVVSVTYLVFTSHERDWSTWHAAELVVEWIIVGLHVVYFSLAWATRADVPVKTYAMFFALLLLTIARTASVERGESVSGQRRKSSSVSAPVISLRRSRTHHAPFAAADSSGVVNRYS